MRNFMGIFLSMAVLSMPGFMWSGNGFADVGANFRVGCSIQDITPSQDEIDAGNISMGGYGFLGIRDLDGIRVTPTKATGVHDPLYARTLLIEQDGKAMALVVIDAAGIGNKILREIAATASAKTGIPANRIFIGNTHSHNALDLQGYNGGVSGTYRAFLIDKTVLSVTQAFNGRVEAKLYASAGEGKNRNRRGWGYTDPSINVLDARRVDDGSRICTLVNFAAHPTILDTEDTELSRDYPGYLVDYAESKLNAPVIFIQGAVGDASADTGGIGETDRFEKARAFGEMTADAALASMTSQTQVEPELYLDTVSFNHPITNTLLVALLTLQRSKLEYDVSYKLFKGYSIQTQVNYLRLGKQMQIAILPGESLTNHTLSIKESMAAPFTMSFSQTTDSLGYLIPSDEWNKSPDGDNYEETFGFDQYLGDTVRDHMLGMIQNDGAMRDTIELKAGFAKRSITPDFVEPWTDENGDGKKQLTEPYEDLNGNGRFDPVYLAGFDMNRPAAGVHDDIYVIAAVLDDGQTRLGILAADCIGLMKGEVDMIRNALPASLNIDHLVVHATHNHETPDSQGMWSILDPDWNEDYVQIIKDQAVEALTEAVANLTPANMYIGEVLDRDDELGIIDTRYPEVLDHGVRVMTFKDKITARTLGTLVNLGNHVETLWGGNLLITADFPGYMRQGISQGIIYDGDVLRQGLGGETLFLTGNIGGLATTRPGVAIYDKYHDVYVEGATFEKAKAQGYALADIVLDASEDGKLVLNERPHITIYTDGFPVKVENPKFILGALLGILDRDFTWLGMEIESEVNLITIGDLWMATIPGELYPEIAVGGIENPVGADFVSDPVEVPALRPAMKGRVNFMVNLANDFIGYLIPYSEWDDEEPWLNNASGDTYGEENSTGPETAALIHGKLMEMFSRVSQ